MTRVLVTVDDFQRETSAILPSRHTTSTMWLKKSVNELTIQKKKNTFSENNAWKKLLYDHSVQKATQKSGSLRGDKNGQKID